MCPSMHMTQCQRRHTVLYFIIQTDATKKKKVTCFPNEALFVRKSL